MNTSISASHLQVTYRVRGIPREYKLNKVQGLLQSVLKLVGTGRDVEVRSIAISPDQKTKMATVNFKTRPACFQSDMNEWSFEIPDVDNIDAKNNDNDDDDIIPKTPTITTDTHFRGITILRSFKNVSEHTIE